jgi:predicted  nucleic acid-binding Zn-ribbon protein
MSFLAPLLQIQDLDLAADGALKRARELSERESLPAIATKIAAAESARSAARAERAALEASEEELGRAVAQISKDIEAADVERYSGKHKDRDEAVAHDEAQQARREQQAVFEEQEMELLEAIEAVESRIETHESAIANYRADSAKLSELIKKVEAEVESEVARLGDTRSTLVSRIPDEVLSTYERVRAQPRNGGRGATNLDDGRCKGCQIKLPSLEKKRMMAEPEDALIQCPQCRRVLVRP